jgi:hypothetical protein
LSVFFPAASDAELVVTAQLSRFAESDVAELEQDLASLSEEELLSVLGLRPSNR